MSNPGSAAAWIVGASGRNRDLDGFAAALEALLGRAVHRAPSVEALPRDTTAPLLLSSRIAPDAVLGFVAVRFGPAALARCLPIGVTQQGAEIAVRRFGTVGGIELRAFAAWSSDRTGFRGASGLILRAEMAALLGLPRHAAYAGLVETAESIDLATQTVRLLQHFARPAS